MRRPVLAVLSLVVAFASITGAAAADPIDPAGNADTGGFGCYDQMTADCLAPALAAFDRARAREGLGPMTLPTNFLSLSVPMQLLVLADIDRVDRGLPPFAGLSSALGRVAQQGADNGVDPDFPPWVREGGANWYSGDGALAAEYLWMYDDGLGAGNISCTAGDRSGCWGHRHNILGDYHAPLLMGAADGAGGIAQLLLGSDGHDSADAGTWAAELAHFPVGAPRAVKAVRGAARLPVWASGRAMTVRIHASAGWSPSRRTCRLSAGDRCTLTVRRRGARTGTLTLRGPNGPVTVRLR